MIKVLLDATPVSENPSGVGFYITNLIQSLYLLRNCQDLEIGILYQPSFKDWLKGTKNLPISLTQAAKNLSIYQLLIPVKLSNLISRFNLVKLLPLSNHFNQFQVIHGNSYTVFRHPKAIKILTIYDLTFIKYPQYVNRQILSYKDRVFQALKWADLVITISENSKKEIIEYLGVTDDRVYVTHLASRYSLSNLVQINAGQLKSEIYNFSEPYLLFVSTIEPRKNIVTLIEAFNLVKSREKICHNLVLIGAKGWKCDPIFKAIYSSPYQNQIYYFNYLPDHLVASFYSQAEAFIYPSYYEGFGLPVLEAMTLGCPVITSNTSSLPEVAGDSALYFDPSSPEDLAEKIWQVISDRSLRSELVKYGLYQSSLFSWEKTAQETLKVYELASQL